MRIIAKRVDEEVYLVNREIDMTGFIADFNKKIRYINRNIYSILARGYWVDFGHNEELMRKILLLPHQ